MKFLYSLLLIPFIALADSQEPVSGSETIEVSEECADLITKLQHDLPRLYYYLKGTFKGVGKLNNPDYRPSLFLDKIISGKVNIDDSLQPQSMPANALVAMIVEGDIYKYDKEFTEKLDELQDVSKTWEWFAEHFKTNAIEKKFKRVVDTCKSDALLLKDLAKRGIYISNDGKTITIYPRD